MAKTQIADVVVPQVFNPYVVQRTAELSALYQSGIIQADPQMDTLASGGGKIVNLPFWNDLDSTSAEEILTDSGALTPTKITAGQDQAILIARGKAWSVNDLAKALAGSDPMATIGDLVANYWARRMQYLVFSILKGVFASATMSGNVSDISAVGGADKITAGTLIDAIQKMGDAKDRISAIAMHSAVEADLAKKDLIQTVRGSDGQIQYKTYMDKRIIVDDGCPASAGVYTTYLFGQGALAHGNGSVDHATETGRDVLAGDDILVNRKSFLLHPRGVKFTASSVAGVTPTNTEFENSANWSRVYDPKNIRIVKFVHKIG